MAMRKPVVVGTNHLVALPDIDTLLPSAIPLSADAGNRIKNKKDGLFVPAVASGDIPVSKAKGNVITMEDDGLFGNPAAPTIPYVRWEIGHSQQANGGRGIDQGDWWQLDLSIGQASNLEGLVNNEDGTVTLPKGAYQIVSDAQLSGTQMSGQYMMKFYGQSYGYKRAPYQVAATHIAQLSAGSVPRTLALASCPLFFDLTWGFGYDKGADGLAELRGFISVLKIG